ncbi:DUF397 domain-containing protein [Streptomyces sp. NPDC087440]|uniref:DUF397 domain-containing protein n=1 Tax=Streptomyces sp. NPDC087440 TaxID=3365790 RepID=UPI0037F1DD53
MPRGAGRRVFGGLDRRGTRDTSAKHVARKQVAQPSAWFKSTYSGSPNDECLMCNYTEGPGVQVGDSKIVGGPNLRITHDAWSRFVDAVSEGRMHRD